MVWRVEIALHDGEYCLCGDKDRITGLETVLRWRTGERLLSGVQGIQNGAPTVRGGFQLHMGSAVLRLGILQRVRLGIGPSPCTAYT